MADISTPSDAVCDMRCDLAKVHALMGGTKAMRAAGEAYLPKWPMEDRDSYDFRLKTSTLFNAFARTVENMSSKPFAEPVKWTGIAPEVEAWFDNIDLAGRNLHVIAHEVFRAGMCDGISHVLVDYPPTLDENGVQLYKTKAAEAAAGVRPYAIHVRQAQILGWISDTVNGAETLVQVRIAESVREPDGPFATKEVEQVRVLTPGAWQTWRKNGKTAEWEPYKSGVTTLKFIPLITFYTRRTGFMTATPPLLDLADLNIKHWQSSSDQDALLHTARVPILALIGVEDGVKIGIGAKTALQLPLGADAKYVEHSGAAIEAGRTSLQDLEDQMESMGAELLIEHAPGDRTATEASLDTSRQQSQLAEMANALEDFLDQMVDVMAAWSGHGDQGDIDVFDDFASISINAATMAPFVTALTLLVEARLMSRETAFEELKRYGVTNPDLVWAEEMKKIDSAPPPATVQAVVT